MDLYVFGPPRSASGSPSQRYGSEDSPPAQYQLSRIRSTGCDETLSLATSRAPFVSAALNLNSPFKMTTFERENTTLVGHSTELVFANLLRSPGSDSQPGGIDSWESIPGLLKRLQIRALVRLDLGRKGEVGRFKSEHVIQLECARVPPAD